MTRAAHTPARAIPSKDRQWECRTEWRLDASSGAWTVTAGPFSLRAVVRPVAPTTAIPIPAGGWLLELLIDGSPVPPAPFCGPYLPASQGAPHLHLIGLALRLLKAGNDGQARRFRPAQPWGRDAEGLLMRLSSSGLIRVEPRSFTTAVKSDWAAYCYDAMVRDGEGRCFWPCAGSAFFGTAEEAAYAVTTMVGRFA